MFVVKELDHLRIPFQDIKVATKNFTTIIGEGGYGPVYTGKLSLSGNLTPVAVKRLPIISLSGQGLKEFLTEIHLLSRYKHPNIVSLLGYCEDHNEKILVYEYAEYGSFDKHLKIVCQLTWKQRLNICIDAARGLDYLHNHVGAHHRVIHRDIKCANILLDQNWKALIADFGLSKIGRANENDTYVITNAGGTLGYCDPVYINTGILTKKSDVYSFGVVLFEALCGRLFFMDVAGKKRLHVPRAKRCYKEGKLKEIVDLNLKDSESVKEFSDIAYQCLHDVQEDRPSMDLVLGKLEKALELHELQEAYELQVVQVFEKARELQELEEALGLQKLVETLQGQEFAEILLLQEFEEALELHMLVETLELHKLAGILELHADYGIIKAIHMMTNDPPSNATKEELYTYLSTGILIDEGKVWFSTDDNGNNQVMISAMKLMHPDPNKFEAIYSSESRFVKVAKVLNASKVDMQVKVRTEFLSSDVTYAAYLVCKQKYHFSGLPILRSLKYKLDNQSKSYISYLRDYKDNGWVMIKLFQTSIHKRNVEIKILLQDFHLDDYWGHDGVIVEGILFLPTQKFDDEKFNKQEVKIPRTWENLLPSDYEELLHGARKKMVKKPKSYVIAKTKEAACSILSKGVYMNFREFKDIDVWFWINKSNGKKCCMLSPQLIKALSPPSGVRFKQPYESRFGCALEVGPSYLSTTCMSLRITKSLLSTNTTYACYLVYKTQRRVENPVTVGITQQMLKKPRGEKNRRYNQQKILYLSTPQSPIIGVPCKKRTPTTTMNKPKMIEYPKKRNDGWWEVRLGEFITYRDNDEQQWIRNFQPWICTCLPWLPCVSDHTRDEEDNATTKFASLCPDDDPLIKINMNWIGHRGWYVSIPHIHVQGIEFRPL